MNSIEITHAITELKGNNFYVFANPEIIDFTDKSQIPELNIISAEGKLVKISLKPEILPHLVSLLRMTIFNKDNKILTWNWKNIASYLLARLGKDFFVDGTLIDIFILEAYSGNRSQMPKTLTEALGRLKLLITKGIWKEIENVYKKIHLPLITTVVPNLENTYLLDNSISDRVYAYYEVEGQNNGRFRNSKEFKYSYLPHALTPEAKNNLKPRDYDEIFMIFDYKGQEVYQLAWMSNDELLLNLCKEQDVYSAISDVIFGNSQKNDRSFVKKIFLPIIYGQSAYSLSEKCSISKDVAETIVARVYTLFPAALAFIESYQKQIQEIGYAKDIFGRRRSFKEGKEYLVRNFAVQSPAALFCFEKLINLHFALKGKTNICFMAHDGFGVYANKENWKDIYKITSNILKMDSEFFPGLKLKISCQAGKSLNNLKTLNSKG